MKQARIRVLLLALTDAICFAVVFLLTAVLYRKFGEGYYFLLYYVKLLPVVLVFLVCNGFIRLYHGNFFYPGTMLPPQEELRRIFFSVTLTYLILTAYLMLTRELHVSRFVLLVSWFFSCLLVVPTRYIARFLMKKCSIGQMPLLIVGAGKMGCEMADLLEKDKYYGWSVAGFIDDNPEKPGNGVTLPRLGGLKDIPAIIEKGHYDYLLCCLPPEIIERGCREWTGVFSHIIIMPPNEILPGAWIYPANMMCHAGFEFRNQLLLSIPCKIKRILDVIISSVGIVCLSPLFLIVALLVKLSSPGPVFYFNKNGMMGYKGCKFKMFKFRSMVDDPDGKSLEKILAENPNLADEWERNHKLENDPRVTPLGKFLRKTSIDELPQLFNVFLGDMSLVGPRPIDESEIEKYGENYDLRKRVKPGITGLWQVSGRSDTSYEDRVRLDLSYILNWSIWLDIHILFRTVAVVLLRKGAK